MNNSKIKKSTISRHIIKIPSQQTAHYTNMYSKYKWDIHVISSNINASKFTPIYQYSPEKTSTHNVMCNICYNYFPAINQTNCCFHHICTECIAATVDPNDLICPFCRKQNFTVTPNQKKENLKADDADDIEYSKYQQKVKDDFDFDEAKGCSDEAIVIAMQYKLDVKIVNELLNAGLSQEEIISNLRGANTHPNQPPPQNINNPPMPIPAPAPASAPAPDKNPKPEENQDPDVIIL